MRALEERFALPSQTELYRVQMRERRQKAVETLPELGQAIRRLTNLAYPTASAEIRETLSKDQFVDALADSEMRIRIKQSRPLNLNDAIQLAVELEAYNRAERKSYARPTTTEPSSETNALSKALSAKFDSLQNEVRDLQVKSQNKKQKTQVQRTCFYCNKPGHVQRHCFARKTELQSNRKQPNFGAKKGKYGGISR
jgi:hypothetical protein